MSIPKFFPAIRAGLVLLFASAIGAIGAVSDASAATGYYTQGGKIYDSNGQELQVRGVNHFGFNTPILVPQYLWQMGWKQQIDQIKSLGFNAIRLPFSPDALYSTAKVDQLSYLESSRNAELIGKTPLQALDLWMAYADSQGIYVMLDFHNVTTQYLYPTWFITNPADFGLVYNNQAYTKDNWVRDLSFVAARYAHLPHFFAVDLFNEPHDVVRWAAGDPNQTNPIYHWKTAAESAAAAVLQANPKILVFVEGITANWDGIENSSLPINWGENLQPQAYQPLNIPNDKLVLSPHTYGPDVSWKPTFNAANFPANLAADWETLFGQFHPAHPVILGEFGGRYGQGGTGQKDVQWQNALVDYLVSKGIRGGFYWCYTPNSGDTGGILDDNLNVREDKMALLRTLWGNPPAPVTPPAPLPPPPAPAPVTPSTLALAAASYTVAQNAGTVSITVNRSGGSSGAISVQYATADGSAHAGTDYTAQSGTLNWADGATGAKTLSIAISNAAPFEGTRAFTLQLSNAGGASLGTPAAATVTINGSAAPARPCRKKSWLFGCRSRMFWFW